MAVDVILGLITVGFVTVLAFGAITMNIFDKKKNEKRGEQNDESE